MAAFYNEIDKFAAAWLRELIKERMIANGEVDERSITEVQPGDLKGFTQCHFFSGIAVWSYALRLAGWPDDRPVWTGSCPCPSFSAAGKGQGFADPRHLWPAWYRLIRECRPAIVFGEQVNAAIGHGWLDLVQTDLEAQGYAVGKAVLGACSVGAPHRRQRLYFVAESESGRPQCKQEQRRNSLLPPMDGARESWESTSACGASTGRMSDAERGRCQQRDAGERGIQEPDAGCTDGELGDADFDRCGLRNGECNSGAGTGEYENRLARPPNVTSSFWGDAEWLWCRDGKWRAVEPGTFPLVTRTAEGLGRGGDSGAPINPNATAEARVGRLRGYGNSIVSPVAEEFIRAYMETVNAV